LVEASLFEDAERGLEQGRWRQGVDLSFVPREMLDRTDVLCARARGLTKYAHPAALTEAITKIITLWS
jgi:hypothetical protein